MIKKQLIVLFCIILSIQNIVAYTYLNIYVEENGDAIFLGETNEELNFPKGVGLKQNNIIGTTTEITNKQGKIWEIKYFLKGAEINVIFPKNIQIKEIEEGEVYLDNDRISVYNIENINIKYTFGENNNQNYLLIGILISIGIFIFLGYYVFSKKKIKNKLEKENKLKNEDRLKNQNKLKKENKLEIIKQTLNEREKLIIDKLKEIKEIKHSQLQKILEIPKASFSRHIQELEKKNLIKRFGEGKNKFISLK